MSKASQLKRSMYELGKKGRAEMSDLVKEYDIKPTYHNGKKAIQYLLDQIEVLKEDVTLLNGEVDLHIDERIKLEATIETLCDALDEAAIIWVNDYRKSEKYRKLAQQCRTELKNEQEQQTQS